MNKIKKVLSVWMLVACVLPVAAQYPVIPDSVKERGAKQEAEFEQKSNAAWEKALPTVLEEAKLGRPYKPWASTTAGSVHTTTFRTGEGRNITFDQILRFGGPRFVRSS